MRAGRAGGTPRKEIAAASLVAAAEIYASMEEAARTVLETSGHATSELVGHRRVPVSESIAWGDALRSFSPHHTGQQPDAVFARKTVLAQAVRSIMRCGAMRTLSQAVRGIVRCCAMRTASNYNVSSGTGRRRAR